MRIVLTAAAILVFAAPAVHQPLAGPSSFDDRAVVVGTDPWKLPATLSMPRASVAVPGVVLVHGSGPSDRDETVGAVKPFRDLALGLAAAGVAVLRYDKRTFVHGARMASMTALTVNEETVDDAVAAATVLRSTPGVNTGRVFVLGHSLGGMLIPRIARADPAAAGFVLMAAPARPLEDLVVEQVRYLISLDGVVTDGERAQLEAVRRIVARIKDPNLSTTTPASDLLGAPGSYWLDLRGYDPVMAAQEIRRPMLVLQGQRDYQVTMVDFERWRAAFSSAGTATVKLYPALNHLFVTGTGPSSPAEYQRPGRIARTVVADIAAWIKTR
jgi:hypothetical protein